MSKLTSFTSASDALIQPTGATSGQTLTWNDATGQFEPTTPTSGATPELLLWQPSTTYAIGDTVLADTTNNAVLRRSIANTSGTTLTVAELSQWDYVGQKLITNFPVGSLVCIGFLISENSTIWRSLSNRITDTVFDSTEQTEWEPLTLSAASLGTSWVEDIRGIAVGNPFASVLPKTNNNGLPYVWRFTSSGAVALDSNTTVISVSTKDRLWYMPSNDTWFHEKDPDVFLGASEAAAGSTGLVGTPQQSDHLRSLRGNSSWAYPYQFIDSYPSPFVNTISIGQGAVIKDGEVYALRAYGDRAGVRLIPEGDWSTAPTITGDTVSSQAWTVTGQPTSGKHECFVYPNFTTFTWEFRDVAITGTASPELSAWLPNTAYVAGDTVLMSSVTWGSWYMRRNAPGTSGAVLDVTELGQWVYVGQAQTFNWQPSQLVPQGLKIVENGRYWERLASGTTQPAGLGFDTTEQANWLALTPALPASLPTFSSGAALMGNGTNVPEADARVTFDGGSGGSGITISASGSGNTIIGNAGTGNIAIGTASTTRLTTLNGIVKRPNMATLYTTGVGQALPANGAVAVNWNAAIITIGSGITVSGTAITLSRTGIYRVYGGISITSATANTRGIIAPVTGTAGFASPSARAVRQTTANIATENNYEFLLNVTTAGTFSIGCTMVAASNIQAFNSTTATAATTTLYIQEIG